MPGAVPFVKGFCWCFVWYLFCFFDVNVGWLEIVVGFLLG